MRFTRCSHLALLLVAALVPILPAQESTPQTTEPLPAVNVTLPQIVRLSLVEGDVRVARGKQDEKVTGNTWEKATANLPLESGFSLATGSDGRAEIEFEDTSTLYLAPNSALTLADLTTKDGVPRTRLLLLSGTVTTHLDPSVPGEAYTMETATHSFRFAYGDQSYARITSFLDAMQITPMNNEKLMANSMDIAATKGESYNIIGGRIVPTAAPSTPALVAWDNWVADRVNSRGAAMQSVMEQAGLKTPLPGLADLAGKGTFTVCAPYGTCWEPAHGWTPQSSDSGQPIRPLPEAGQTSTLVTTSQTNPRSRGVAPALVDEDLDYFPCDPTRLYYLRIGLLLQPDAFYPYDWAVCHAGAWIYHQHRYMWVAGTHKHHRCPVRWVKYQGKLGYVPIHPRDQRGQPPINLRHGVYTLNDKANQPIQRIALDGRSQPKVLDSTPKDFRNPAPLLLARADAPQLEVHTLHESPRTGAAPAHSISSSLTFNPHSERFMLATRVTDGGRTHTYSEPMSDRSGHIPAPTSNGFRGESSGGGGGGHYSGGGGASGGHSGGGFGGGGGGSHSSGGGGSSSASSSSGGASSGGGGSHH